jgi:hypothetical protein
VIKRNRGNGGQGVWKVEALAGPRDRPMVRVLDAIKGGYMAGDRCAGFGYQKVKALVDAPAARAAALHLQR